MSEKKLTFWHHFKANLIVFGVGVAIVMLGLLVLI